MAFSNPLPPLDDEDYDALKASIKEHGFWPSQAVTVDENGDILDGFNRAKAATELGIEYPVTVLAGLSDWEKLQYAVKANMVRRQVSPAQRRVILKRLIEEHDAALKAEARKAQSEGGRKAAAARKASAPPADAKRAAAADATLDDITAAAVPAVKERRSTAGSAPGSPSAGRQRPSRSQVPGNDRLSTYASLVGVSRATVARDKAALDRIEKIEREAQRQGRDDVIAALDGPRPDLAELERQVGLRGPVEEERHRLAWVDALVSALEALAPRMTDEEVDYLISKTDASGLIIQLRAMTKTVAERKQASP